MSTSVGNHLQTSVGAFDDDNSLLNVVPHSSLMQNQYMIGDDLKDSDLDFEDDYGFDKFNSYLDNAIKNVTNENLALNFLPDYNSGSDSSLKSSASNDLDHHEVSQEQLTSDFDTHTPETTPNSSPNYVLDSQKFARFQPQPDQVPEPEQHKSHPLSQEPVTSKKKHSLFSKRGTVAAGDGNKIKKFGQKLKSLSKRNKGEESKDSVPQIPLGSFSNLKKPLPSGSSIASSSVSGDEEYFRLNIGNDTSNYASMNISGVDLRNNMSFQDIVTSSDVAISPRKPQPENSHSQDYEKTVNRPQMSGFMPSSYTSGNPSLALESSKSYDMKSPAFSYTQSPPMLIDVSKVKNQTLDIPARNPTRISNSVTIPRNSVAASEITLNIDLDTSTLASPISVTHGQNTRQYNQLTKTLSPPLTQHSKFDEDFHSEDSAYEHDMYETGAYSGIQEVLVKVKQIDHKNNSSDVNKGKVSLPELSPIDLDTTKPLSKSVYGTLRPSVSRSFKTKSMNTQLDLFINNIESETDLNALVANQGDEMIYLETPQVDAIDQSPGKESSYSRPSSYYPSVHSRQASRFTEVSDDHIFDDQSYTDFKNPFEASQISLALSNNSSPPYPNDSLEELPLSVAPKNQLQPPTITPTFSDELQMLSARETKIPLQQPSAPSNPTAQVKKSPTIDTETPLSQPSTTPNFLGELDISDGFLDDFVSEANSRINSLQDPTLDDESVKSLASSSSSFSTTASLVAPSSMPSIRAPPTSDKLNRFTVSSQELENSNYEQSSKDLSQVFDSGYSHTAVIKEKVNPVPETSRAFIGPLDDPYKEDKRRAKERRDQKLREYELKKREFHKNASRTIKSPNVNPNPNNLYFANGAKNANPRAQPRNTQIKHKTSRAPKPKGSHKTLSTKPSSNLNSLKHRRPHLNSQIDEETADLILLNKNFFVTNGRRTNDLYHATKSVNKKASKRKAKEGVVGSSAYEKYINRNKKSLDRNSTASTVVRGEVYNDISRSNIQGTSIIDIYNQYQNKDSQLFKGTMVTPKDILEVELDDAILEVMGESNRGSIASSSESMTTSDVTFIENGSYLSGLTDIVISEGSLCGSLTDSTKEYFDKINRSYKSSSKKKTNPVSVPISDIFREPVLRLSYASSFNSSLLESPDFEESSSDEQSPFIDMNYSFHEVAKPRKHPNESEAKYSKEECEQSKRDTLARLNGEIPLGTGKKIGTRSPYPVISTQANTKS